MCRFENYESAIKKCRPTVSERLWHYCRVENIKYLFEHGRDIACRYITYMSQDKEEVIAGCDAFVNYLKRYGEYSWIADAIQNNIRLNYSDKVSTIVPLTFSFTEKVDSQYHWTEYTKNNGYAVAFSHERISNACDLVVKNDRVSLDIVPCFYLDVDYGEIDKIFAALLDDIKEELDNLKKDINHQQSGRRVLTGIFQMSVGIKRSRFSSDREWRLVMVSENEFQKKNEDGFRDSGLRKYCANDDIANLIDGIAICPKGDQDQLLNVLKQYKIQDRNRGLKCWMDV